jgi:hypothetical protein
MPKNLTNGDLQLIEEHADTMIGQMVDASEQLRKMRVEKLDKLLHVARTCAILARDAANLSTFLLMQHDMQEQRAEIDRLRAKAGQNATAELGKDRS